MTTCLRQGQQLALVLQHAALRGPVAQAGRTSAAGCAPLALAEASELAAALLTVVTIPRERLTRDA